MNAVTNQDDAGQNTAIEELARVVATKYMADRPSETESSSDEFLSAIESEIRSTVRDQLQKLATMREVEGTPTLDPTSSSGMDMTIDGAFANVDVTLDPGAGVGQSTDFATMDSANPVDISGNVASAAVRTGAKSGSGSGSSRPMVRSGGKNASDDKSARAAGEQSKAPPDYEILSTLGKGGMGVVYKARHVPLDRTVAVKMIISGAHASGEQISRFQAEAEAAAHLKHPNIVSVYEVGEHQGLPYFSLEFVDGPSMSELMNETTMSGKEAAELLLSVARAVEYSHEMGVLHRDLKPQNILITEDGVPKVADFGLAKRLDDENSQTVTGVVVGTPGYLAPEQAADTKKVGRHTDVYALGCILYYMMTGRPPYKAPTAVEAVRQLLYNDPVPPSQLQTSLDKDLETICLKALEKEIPKRYQTAGEFADELERFVKGEPILARPVTRWERVVKWCKRNPKIAVLSAVTSGLLLFLMIGGIFSAFVINEQKKLAVQNGLIAKDQAEVAKNATRVVLYKTKDFFDEHPELTPLRQSMLSSIANDIERIHSDRYEDGATDTLRAAATNQLGQIYLSTGHYEKAIQSLLAAEDQLKKLNAKGQLARARESQMDLSIAIGDTYREIGELETAEKRYLQVLEMRQEYFDNAKSVSALMKQQGMAEVYGRLQRIYQDLGKPDQTLKYALLSTEARRAWFAARPNSLLAMEELTGALGDLSVAYERRGELNKMIQTSTELLGLSSAISRYKSDSRTLHNVATQQKKLARQSLVINENDQAAELLQGAIKTFSELLEFSPEDQRMMEQAADTHYLHGIAMERLKKDSKPSFAKAAVIQESLIAKSDNVNTRGMMLKILARSGEVEKAKGLADKFAASPEKMMNCGYASCGYALLSVFQKEPDRNESIDKAIDLTQRLIQHGYHDFESMRTTDLDFAPLQKNPRFLKMLKDEEAKQEKKK